MSPVQPEIHENRRIASVAELATRRGAEAWSRFAQAQSHEEFCASWLAIQCDSIGGVSDGVVLLQAPGAREYVPVAFYPDAPRDRTHLAEIAERTLKEGRGVVLPVEVPAITPSLASSSRQVRNASASGML